jgi:hypothetical protein
MLRGFRTRKPTEDLENMKAAQAFALAMSRRSLDDDARARIEAAWAGFEATPAPQAAPLHGSLPPLQPATPHDSDGLRLSRFMRRVGLVLGMSARWSLIAITVLALIFVSRGAAANVTIPEISIDWLRVALPIALLGGSVLLLLRIGRGLIGLLGLGVFGPRGPDPFDRFAAQVHDSNATPR